MLLNYNETMHWEWTFDQNYGNTVKVSDQKVVSLRLIIIGPFISEKGSKADRCWQLLHLKRITVLISFCHNSTSCWIYTINYSKQQGTDLCTCIFFFFRFGKLAITLYSYSHGLFFWLLLIFFFLLVHPISYGLKKICFHDHIFGKWC